MILFRAMAITLTDEPGLGLCEGSLGAKLCEGFRSSSLSIHRDIYFLVNSLSRSNVIPMFPRMSFSLISSVRFEVVKEMGI